MSSSTQRHKVYALYRRRMTQAHAECVGRYTREVDAISDRDKFNRAFPRSVFTVVAEPESTNPRVKKYG